MAFPSPRRLPEFWQTCVVGSFNLPPVKDRGTVQISITASLKKDDKKKAGKDGSKPAIERIEPDKIEIEYQFNEDSWEENEAVIAGLKPDGTPRDISHPLASVYGISAMLIEQASPVTFADGIFTITWSGESWKAPAAQGQQLYLRRGSTGPEVTRWQTFLTEQKFGEAEGFSPIDGIFGILTEDGTKGFQEREKIKVDGIVGPETFGAASKYGYVPPPPVKGGSGGGVKTPEQAAAAAVGAAAGDVVDAAGDLADAAGEFLDDAADAFLGGDENGDSGSGESSGEGGGATAGGNAGYVE